MHISGDCFDVVRGGDYAFAAVFDFTGLAGFSALVADMAATCTTLLVFCFNLLSK